MPGRHVGRGGAAASWQAARVQRFQEYRGSSVQGLRRKLWEPQPSGGAGAARQRMLAARSGGVLDQSSQHECWSSNTGEGLWWRWGGGLGKLGWHWGKVGGWGVSKGWASAVPVPAVRILCCCSNQLVQRAVNDGAGVGRGPAGLARRCRRAGGRRGGRRRQRRCQQRTAQRRQIGSASARPAGWEGIQSHQRIHTCSHAGRQVRRSPAGWQSSGQAGGRG